MSLAPHRLYGVVPAREAYSVGRWLEDAARALQEAEGEGRMPILVGGTGLYFKALIEGLAPVPDVPPEIRKAWRERAEKLGAEGLYRELEAPRSCHGRDGFARATRSVSCARSR